MVPGRRLRLGIAGLGRGFMLMLPTLAQHPDIELVAAADPREAARTRFAADYGGRTHATVAALCRDPDSARTLSRKPTYWFGSVW